jgi:hypothetical protein
MTSDVGRRCTRTYLQSSAKKTWFGRKNQSPIEQSSTRPGVHLAGRESLEPAKGSEEGGG